MAARERLVGVGVFVLGAIALFAIGLFMIGDRQMAFARKFTIYTQFAKITGLQPGAIVRVSGAKAGTVQSILPPASPSERFRVRIEIAEELHPLVRANSIASIETEGLVGGSYLAIAAGTAQASPAPPESTIPSREPFEIADLLQQMSTTIRNVNDTIDMLKADVQHAIQSIGETVDSANQLLTEVSANVTTMARAGARISNDAAEIAERIQRGEGTLGKLLNDDELYERGVAIARSAEAIAADARGVVQQARKAIDDLQSRGGPVGTLTQDLRQTMAEARNAMAGFADNMEALKRNFLLRGFFNDRGYFSLSEISPAAYRRGVLTQGKGMARTVARTWLDAAVLFEPAPNDAGLEVLTEEGRQRLDEAIAPMLDRVTGGILVVEGYARGGRVDEQYVRSRMRAVVARDYLIGKFGLEPRRTGVMPLGADSAGSPGGAPWEGVALALFLEKK